MDMIRKNIFQSFIMLILLLVSQLSFAVVIAPNTVINVSTTYSNQTLDMTNGSFIVKNNATLTIDNCTVLGTLSLANPTLINVEVGTLKLNNSRFITTTQGIAPHPNTESLQYIMHLNRAKLEMTGNKFIVDKPFTVGVLVTSVTIATDNIHVEDNIFENFHGVLYLLNSANTVIESNLFRTNSYGNIVLVGDNSVINNNKILFAGRDELGNAMDIIDSSDVAITNNVLFTSTCHGIYSLLSHNVLIDSNSITGGITYAINLFSTVNLEDKDNYAMRLLKKLGKKRMNHAGSSNITVTNNVMSQNRYGLAARDIDQLLVTDNYFSQRFEDATARQFWTNNVNILKNVTNLIWNHNIYKEAFTQINGGDNTMTQFVPFPTTGGVVL